MEQIGNANEYSNKEVIGGNMPGTYVPRTHRVGTVTCGLMLIIYGILFLVHMAVPTLNYLIIFRLWPIIFIMLGLEILISSMGKNQDSRKFVYDFPAVLIIIMLMVFAMIMAAVEAAVRWEGCQNVIW